MRLVILCNPSSYALRVTQYYFVHIHVGEKSPGSRAITITQKPTILIVVACHTSVVVRKNATANDASGLLCKFRVQYMYVACCQCHFLYTRIETGSHAHFQSWLCSGISEGDVYQPAMSNEKSFLCSKQCLCTIYLTIPLWLYGVHVIYASTMYMYGRSQKTFPKTFTVRQFRFEKWC